MSDVVKRGARRIVCAAIRCPYTHRMVVGPRHGDGTMRLMLNQAGLSKWTGWDQGFIDQWGQWLTRGEAWKIAEAAGQIRFRCGGDESNGGTLYSENLY